VALVCSICGNEFESTRRRCPYCGQKAADIAPPVAAGPLHRTVNLERGLPTVDEALARLEAHLQAACREGVRVLTLIHGYGSTGSGGRIRTEVRRRLAWYEEQGRISGFVPGERFGQRQGPGKQLVRRFPALAHHPDLDRHNPGITLVVLRRRRPGQPC